MLQIAVCTGLIQDHIEATEKTEIPPNSFVTKEYLLEMYADLKNKLDAAWDKGVKQTK